MSLCSLLGALYCLSGPCKVSWGSPPPKKKYIPIRRVVPSPEGPGDGGRVPLPAKGSGAGWSGPPQKGLGLRGGWGLLHMAGGEIGLPAHGPGEGRGEIGLPEKRPCVYTYICIYNAHINKYIRTHVFVLCRIYYTILYYMYIHIYMFRLCLIFNVFV